MASKGIIHFLPFYVTSHLSLCLLCVEFNEGSIHDPLIRLLPFLNSREEPLEWVQLAAYKHTHTYTHTHTHTHTRTHTHTHMIGIVTQLAQHWPRNLVVLGSSPIQDSSSVSLSNTLSALNVLCTCTCTLLSALIYIRCTCTYGVQLRVCALSPLEEGFLLIDLGDVVSQLAQSLLDPAERERERERVRE